MIRLMIVDDHAIMREGLKQLCALASDIQVVAEATNGQEVIDRLREEEVDVLLLDLTMPGISGDDLITRLRLRHPQLPILILSMHNAPHIAQRALRAGAAGYVAKDRDPEMLLAAIRKVASGRRFIDPVLAEKMILENSSQNGQPAHSELSDREFQILCYLARGLAVSEIANELSISNKTVSTHKARLMEKMNFANNAELMRYAITYGLVD